MHFYAKVINNGYVRECVTWGSAVLDRAFHKRLFYVVEIVQPKLMKKVLAFWRETPILIDKELQPMQAKKGLNVMNEYLLRRYDTYFNDVRNETIIECVDDETAIRAARQSLFLTIHPKDTVEMQVCRKGLGKGEWVMFAAVYYDDDEIVVDDCFC